MDSISVTPPAELDGKTLVAELQAGGVAAELLALQDGLLHVGGSVSESDRTVVEQTVADHVPPPPPPDPDDELDAALAAVDTSTVSDAATRDAIDAVVAALRGTAGRKGAAAGRRPT